MIQAHTWMIQAHTWDDISSYMDAYHSMLKARSLQKIRLVLFKHIKPLNLEVVSPNSSWTSACLCV